MPKTPLFRSEDRCSTVVVARFRPKFRARCAACAKRVSWGGKLNEVLDAVESAEADIQEDIEFALVQMKSETLNKINDALGRLEQGNYGNCFDCGEEIAEKRLRALPFAVRCKDCEEARENAEQRRASARRRGAAPARCSSTCNQSGVPILGSAGGGAHLLPTGIPFSIWSPGYLALRDSMTVQITS